MFQKRQRLYNHLCNACILELTKLAMQCAASHRGRLWPKPRYRAVPRRQWKRLPRATHRPGHVFFEDEGGMDEAVVLLLKTGGIVQIPPRLSASDLRQPIQHILEKHPLPLAEEQAICMAGTFWVAASNGVDIQRKIHFQVSIVSR